MSPSLQLVSIRLRVPNLARSLAFYKDAVGFSVARQSDSEATLSTAPGEPPILFLETSAAPRPAPRQAAGLFHAALLFPNRASLGGWLRLAAERRIPFQGFSDH